MSAQIKVRKINSFSTAALLGLDTSKLTGGQAYFELTIPGQIKPTYVLAANERQAKAQMRAR